MMIARQMKQDKTLEEQEQISLHREWSDRSNNLHIKILGRSTR